MHVLSTIGLVAAGGAMGALARYGIALAFQSRMVHFPMGTLVANFVGCLLAGVLMFFVLDRPGLPAGLRLFLMVGFLGAMTTFSSFSVETLALSRHGHGHLAILNIAANLVVSLAAAWAGWAAARAIWTT